MPKVAFICVHNSCRSQIAEALGKLLAHDAFESFSAGTLTKPCINPDAVRLMRELYGIDMEATQRPKLIGDIPAPDIAISMGCDVGCPFIGRPFDDDWGLGDPTGLGDEAFIEVIRQIEGNIRRLREDVIGTGGRGTCRIPTADSPLNHRGRFCRSYPCRWGSPLHTLCPLRAPSERGTFFERPKWTVVFPNLRMLSTKGPQ